MLILNATMAYSRRIIFSSVIFLSLIKALFICVLASASAVAAHPPQPRTQDYQALGVSVGASTEEIKQAYRKIALQTHPDRHPGDKIKLQRFIRATEAYDRLSKSQNSLIVLRELQLSTIQKLARQAYSSGNVGTSSTRIFRNRDGDELSLSSECLYRISKMNP